MNRGKIQRTLRECLLKEDKMDEYLDLINQKGMDGLEYDDLKDAPQSLIKEFMKKAIENKVEIDSDILRLVDDRELVDKYLDSNVINQKGIGDLNFDDLKNASQDLIIKFMEKAIKEKIEVDSDILNLVEDQELIDKYMLMRIKDRRSIEYSDIKKASQHVVDEYIKSKYDKGVKIRPKVLELASQEIIDEYIKRGTNLGVFFDPEHLALASEEAKEYYKNNKAQLPR